MHPFKMAADELNHFENRENSFKPAFKRSSERGLVDFDSPIKKAKVIEPKIMSAISACDTSFIEETKGKENLASNNSSDNELTDMNDTTHSSSAVANTLWIEKKVKSGFNPRLLLKSLFNTDDLPNDIEDATLWHIIASIMTEPPKRNRLEGVTTFDDVIRLIKQSKRIIVLTGAGVSVSCGIPDFRSRNGIYARLSIDYPDLPDPQAMFDINYFRRNPKPFFKFAKEIYPGLFSPSTAHRFIGVLEASGRLLRNYTQNIDTLEPLAHISKLIQCHGSFSTATCMRCRLQVDAEEIREDVMKQVIPMCRRCGDGAPAAAQQLQKHESISSVPEKHAPQNFFGAVKYDSEDSKITTTTTANVATTTASLGNLPIPEQAILKPDIVFFGESLSEEFHKSFEEDKHLCDLLIVMGSSLKVKPVAIIPDVLPAKVPQVLINRESLPHMHFDVELLGDCDEVVRSLCAHLADTDGGVFKQLLEGQEKGVAVQTFVSEEGLDHLVKNNVKTQEDFNNIDRASQNNATPTICITTETSVAQTTDTATASSFIASHSSKATSLVESLDQRDFHLENNTSPSLFTLSTTKYHLSSVMPQERTSSNETIEVITTTTTATNSTTTSTTIATTTTASTTTTTTTTNNNNKIKTITKTGIQVLTENSDAAVDFNKISSAYDETTANNSNEHDEGEDMLSCNDDDRECYVDVAKERNGDCAKKEHLDVAAFLNGATFALLSARKYVFAGAEVTKRVLNESPSSSSSSSLSSSSVSSSSDGEDEEDNEKEEEEGGNSCQENVFKELQTAHTTDAAAVSPSTIMNVTACNGDDNVATSLCLHESVIS